MAGLPLEKFNKSIIIQWCYRTANIPGMGGLKCTLPVAYTGNYTVVGTMFESGGANDSRLMIWDKQKLTSMLIGPMLVMWIQYNG